MLSGVNWRFIQMILVFKLGQIRKGIWGFHEAAAEQEINPNIVVCRKILFTLKTNGTAAFSRTATF